jgi:hypothetical protein
VTGRPRMTRRPFLLGLGAGACARAAPSAIRLHIGTYGMQTLAVDRALELIRETGYDGAVKCANNTSGCYAACFSREYSW